MKKIALAAAVAGSLIAMPAVAETKADPFVSTQGALGGMGLAAIGATTVFILVAASDGT
ncbi:hypothetical protein RXV86_16535 [Alisedimentitalea sp. MJ-SS2]|uniref:hypothetical protein n=1 Tax=Aliisedimentitalea sp. MJ-SS2 TaxID=3049795 RepID=UPI002906AA05|nr:hypothetical protein [Alisedimentitalea sp. MJ-SS2]MDU8929003.1 hypothetical protein [Alisedimentitalea sp. MJ-SS2]